MDVGKITEKTNSFDSGVENLGADETDEQFEMENLNPYDSSSSGLVFPTSHHRTYGETSFIAGVDERTPMLREGSQENREEAAKIIKSKFPYWNPLNSSFNATLNSRGEVIVTLAHTRKAVPHVLIDADGNVYEKVLKTSKKIRTSLGVRFDKIVETNEEEIERRNKKISELQDQRATTSDKNQIGGLDQTIDEEQDAINQLERANEEIEQRMTLRDRVKTIFKKIWVHRICRDICRRRDYWCYRG